ncbi:hypothetical protein ACSBR2_005862 [Camellia fascicularis]
MANNEQGEKIGDDIPSGGGKFANLNMEEENRNEGARDQNPGENNIGQKGDAPKKAGREKYYRKSNLQVGRDKCRRKDEKTERHDK